MNRELAKFALRILVIVVGTTVLSGLVLFVWLSPETSPGHHLASKESKMFAPEPRPIEMVTRDALARSYEESDKWRAMAEKLATDRCSEATLVGAVRLADRTGEQNKQSGQPWIPVWIAALTMFGGVLTSGIGAGVSAYATIRTKNEELKRKDEELRLAREDKLHDQGRAAVV